MAILDKADCFPLLTRSSETSSSNKMGEIIVVNLRVDTKMNAELRRLGSADF
jgi:hypothetical protein